MLFEKCRIGKLELVNRAVRSATADADIAGADRVTEIALARYETIACNNTGLIITGDLPVINSEMLENMSLRNEAYDYDAIRIDDLEKLPERIHSCSEAKVIAQISNDLIFRIPSVYDSAYSLDGFEPASPGEINAIVECFIRTALQMEKAGFDGVQIHAAHGGLLSLFLSPWSNHRTDDYGGSVEANCLIIRKIVEGIKRESSDFPVLLKMNSTDYLPGGIGADNLQAYASELESTGLDAIEFSGGMWESLCQPEDELGFPPVPTAESHINLNNIDDQSYFRTFTATLKIGIPRILVGGNKDYSVAEDILKTGQAELISFCRPFICEPDFLSRWKNGDTSGLRCISCNSCIYDMWFHPGSDKDREIYCLYNKSREDPTFRNYFTDAAAWRNKWVEANRGK